MHTKIFIGVLIGLLFTTPTGFTFAKQSDSTMVSLEQKLDAINHHVKRISTTWNPSKQAPVSDEILHQSILDSIGWLQSAQEPNGHFKYEYLPYEGEYRNDDNIVRQAGTLYALSETTRNGIIKSKKDERTIAQAIAYLESVSPEHQYNGTTVRCVTKNKTSKMCPLGATALTLIGVLSYVEAYPEKAETYKNLIQGYANFILASKTHSKGFLSEYRRGSGFTADKESPFFNGEALLALVRYYKYAPSDATKDTIDSAFTYLKDTPFDVNLYLWAMAALKDMNVLWPNHDYTDYGERFTTWRMGRLTATHATTRNYCPVVEGLASAYSLLQDSAPTTTLQSIRREIDFGNTKNLLLQIRTGERYRFIDTDASLAMKEVRDLGQAQGGFLTAHNEPTQRIDFTQHCMNAYLQTLVDIDGYSTQSTKR